MSDTPNTHTVRVAWIRSHPFPLTTDTAEREAEFDRWHQAELRKARVEALREAADEINGESTLLNVPRPETAAQSWLHDRADQIEGE